MKKRLLFLVITVLVSLSNAYAETGETVSGSMFFSGGNDNFTLY